MTARVIHVREMRDHPDALYIGRPMPRQRLAGSRWANPYRITPDQPRDRVLALYRVYVEGRPDLLVALPELAGRVLACWCAPPGGVTADDPLICHGQVLLRMLAERRTRPARPPSEE